MCIQFISSSKLLFRAVRFRVFAKRADALWCHSYFHHCQSEMSAAKSKYIWKKKNNIVRTSRIRYANNSCCAEISESGFDVDDFVFPEAPYTTYIGRMTCTYGPLMCCSLVLHLAHPLSHSLARSLARSFVRSPMSTETETKTQRINCILLLFVCREFCCQNSKTQWFNLIESCPESFHLVIFFFIYLINVTLYVQNSIHLFAQWMCLV